VHTTHYGNTGYGVSSPGTENYVVRFIKESFGRLHFKAKVYSHLSTAVAWREKKFKHFVFYKYFSLVLGLLKSRIAEKVN
jgi:hypothetical protein